MNAPSPIVMIPTTPKVSSEWFQSFALLVATGGSINMCAQRLGKPIVVLEKAFAMPEFQELVKSIAKESAGDASTQMVRGSAIDSVMTLIEIRDNKTNGPAIRSKVAMYLLDRVHGVKKDGIGQSGNDLSDTLSKYADQDLHTSIDAEIKRYLDNNPDLRPPKAAVTAAAPVPLHPSTTEPGQRGRVSVGPAAVSAATASREGLPG